MNFDDLKDAPDRCNRAVLKDFGVFLDRVSLVVNGRNKLYFVDFQLPNDQDTDLIERSYDYLIPFAVESARGHRDIYCYDFDLVDNPKVAVFSGHAIVSRWDSVSEFLRWLGEIAESSSPRNPN